MLPTLHVNQRVLVNRIGMHFSSPHVGEIIVFHPPKNFDDGCADPTQGQNEPGRTQRVRRRAEQAVIADVHQAAWWACRVTASASSTGT